jgi:hypothetical protein
MSLFRRAVFVLLTAIILLQISAVAETPPHSPNATLTPPPVYKKCCVCLVPNANERDHHRFFNECQTCFTDPAFNPEISSCDLVATLINDRFTNFINETNCSNRVHLINNQHGPMLTRLVSVINVCLQKYPSCVLTINDQSCESFKSDERAQAAIERIRANMGTGARIDVCGNASENITLNCLEYSTATKTIIISPDESTVLPSMCNEGGRLCSPAGFSYTCSDTLGRKFKQTCCATRGSDAVWSSPGHPCGGFPSCPPGCTSESRCLAGDVFSYRECVELKAGGYSCLRLKNDCGYTGMACDPKKGCFRTNQYAFERRQTPAATPTIAQVKPTLLVPTLRVVNKSVFLFSAPQSAMKEVATPKNFFGNSSMSLTGGPAGSSGIVLRDVDEASVAGVLGMVDGDAIHFVDEVPVKDLSGALKPLLQERRTHTISFTREEIRYVAAIAVRD